MSLTFTAVRAEHSAGNGSSEQVVLDQWTWVGVCGGCVDGCGCWVADNGRGRDYGGRHCDAVVVSSHVLRAVGSDHGLGGGGHDRCGGHKWRGNQAGRGGDGHGDQTAGDDGEQ